MLISCNQLLTKYKIDVTGIIHVGSHLLEEKNDYNTVFNVEDTNIIWFDANQNIVNDSKQKYPNSLIYPVALSDIDDKDTQLIVTNSTQSSSLLELGLHKQEYAWCHETSRVLVRTKRLDTWFSENQNVIENMSCNFINIDVQGTELNVLKGLGANIMDFDYIYTEINIAEMYLNCCLVNQIDEYLSQFGFDRVETKLASQNWGDSFYMKKPFDFQNEKNEEKNEENNEEKNEENNEENNLEIWCISLEKSIKRKQNICKFSEQYDLNINYFSAISGIDVNVCNSIIEYDNTQYYYDSTKRKLKLSYGEIGCLLSHLQLFENLVKFSNCSHYVILEDDAKLDLEASILLKKTINDIQQNDCHNIDLVQLSKCITHFEPIMTNNYNKNFSNIESKCFNMMNGYIISKIGAEKVLQSIQSLLPEYKYNITVPIDNILSNLFLQNKLTTVIPINKNKKDIRMISCDSFESSIWNVIKPNEDWNNIIHDKPKYIENIITMPNFGIHCRLGNQMFQYAVMKAIELKTNTKLYLKSEWFNETRCRLKIAFGNNVIYKELTNEKQNTITGEYGEKNFMYDANIWNEVSNKSQNIYGYFQSYKYFDEYRDWILNYFTFQKSIVQECKNTIEYIKECTNTEHVVGVHIRLGDLQHANKDGQIYTISSVEYIQQAINKMNKITNTECYYIICSDSKQYCKNNYNFTNKDHIIYIETDTTDYQDMCLLSLCDHMIMSASSFSFWAAYLNKKSTKQIIYPYPWFNKNCARVCDYDTNDLLPNEWIKITV